MKLLNEKVKNLFESQPLWYVGTCSDKPNVSIIGFKEFLDDGRILLCDVFMKHTIDNIKKNGNVCVTACNPDTMEAYQIFGKAVYQTEGESLESWKAIAASMSGGKLQPKGLVYITPEKVRVMSASRDNGKEL